MMNNRPKATQAKPETISRRNGLVYKFFQRINMPIRLVGDANCPAIIYKDTYCLSCYVKNFVLCFTDRPHEATVIAEYVLDNVHEHTREEILALLDKAEHRKVFKIKYKDSNLFLAGYNFTDKSKQETIYPVFSRENMKIFFTEEFAAEIVAKYPDYPLEIC